MLTTTPDHLSEPARVLLTYIREKDWVTYVEVERVLAPYIPVRGDYAIEHPTIDNLLFWCGVSAEVCAIVNELFEARQIWRVPAERLAYHIDGKVLSLPIPRRVQQRYAKPYWLPTCLRATEQISPADRKKYGRVMGPLA